MPSPQKSRWENASPQQRKIWIDAMTAGKKKVYRKQLKNGGTPNYRRRFGIPEKTEVSLSAQLATIRRLARAGESEQVYNMVTEMLADMVTEES